MHSPLLYLLPLLGNHEDFPFYNGASNNTQTVSRRRRLTTQSASCANQVMDCKSSSPSWTWTEDFLHQELPGDSDDGGGYEYEYEDLSDGGETTDAYSSPMLDERGGEHLSSTWAESAGSGNDRRDGDSIQTRRGTLSGSRNQQNSRKGSRPSQQQKRQHSPVVYQFFAKSNNKQRGPPSPDEVNFILLGPNVDHWKQVGQILASRGFNVMACERVEEEHNEATIQGARDSRSRSSEGATTIDSDAPHLVLEMAGTFSLKICLYRFVPQS